jgi:GTP cyclohydrolase FolE2
MSERQPLLPTYTRVTPPFEQLFGASVGTVLHAMDEAGDDLVRHPPRLPLDLARVGYRAPDLLLGIADPFGSGRIVTAIAVVRVATMVPSTQRGVHMSRIGDVLARAAQRTHRDAGAYACALAEALDACQYGGPTRVDVRACVPYLEDVPAETGPAKRSLERLTLLGSARTDGAGGVNLRAGLRFTHIVACPCVQKTYRHAERSRGGYDRGDIAGDSLPRVTHSQRCVTSVMATGVSGPLPIPDLLAALDRVVVRCMNTLPRGAELALVFRAHREPQFIEDALRESLWAFARGLGPLGAITRVEGRSRSAESIHDFDLTAHARLSVDDLARCHAAAAECQLEALYD